jgi:hypothetical protein
MMIKIIYVLIAVAVILGVSSLFISNTAEAPNQVEPIACTLDAMMCPGGVSVGRSGPTCEFVCPESQAIPVDIQAQINSKEDLIKLASPFALSVIESPLLISGEARGYWFFEASFPIYLTNWDGLIIAEGFAQASGDWMTEDFVPYSASLDFVNPYNPGDSDFMKKGTLVLKKDNPSGLPENDDALEIPVRFAP